MESRARAKRKIADTRPPMLRLAVRRAACSAQSAGWLRHNAAPMAMSARFMCDDMEVARRLTKHTEMLHNTVLRPINERLLGPLEKESSQFPVMPMVFLLGNHSSGKSSFINYILHKQVQKAGVAPTDDGFTIIAPGTVNLDQDGPSLVGDPDLGFEGLRVFGTSLINHLHLKVGAAARRLHREG